MFSNWLRHNTFVFLEAERVITGMSDQINSLDSLEGYF